MAVFPHFLNDSVEREPYDEDQFSNTSIRIGEVIDIYETDDDRNDSGGRAQTQYIVQLLYRDGNGPTATAPYKCTIADLFGGLGDSIRFTLRAATSHSSGASDGARVLVACPNGETAAAVIIGGYKNYGPSKSKPKVDPGMDAGHHFDFEFNGVALGINKDGEVSLSVKGPTDNLGNVKAEIGSSVTILKDGSFKISDKGSEWIQVDATKKQINFNSGGAVNIEAATEAIIKAPQVNVAGNKVTLGTAPSFGVTLFEPTMAWANAHQHLAFGIPTVPGPLPLLAAAGSSTVKVSP